MDVRRYWCKCEFLYTCDFVFVVRIYIKVRNHSRVGSCHSWDTWKPSQRFSASGSRNVHKPCKLQQWSSAQSASSGLLELSESSVPVVSDNTKCASRAACMHTHFQSFEFQPSIITNLRGGIVCSLRVCLCLKVWNVRERRFAFHGCKNLPRFFWFWTQKSFFLQKIQYVAIFYCSGWLVGWLWFGTTLRDVCHHKETTTTTTTPKKITVPLGLKSDFKKRRRPISKKVIYNTHIYIYKVGKWIIIARILSSRELDQRHPFSF